jgi:hypothetical protein
MKAIFLSALAVLISAAPAPKPVASAAAPAKKITGDYVEVRTASVFAGACHYNGELVTTGRDAVMAISFTAGSWNNTSLAGVRAVAAVTSDANLGQENATRKVELTIDSKATEAQATALTALLKEKCKATLGEITSVRRAPVSFIHKGSDYAVKADGIATLDVQPMPNNECCAQPHLVWYQPLVPLTNRKVGYTQSAAYLAGTVGEPWQREGENSAFYGSFSF